MPSCAMQQAEMGTSLGGEQWEGLLGVLPGRAVHVPE